MRFLGAVSGLWASFTFLGGGLQAFEPRAIAEEIFCINRLAVLQEGLPEGRGLVPNPRREQIYQIYRSVEELVIEGPNRNDLGSIEWLLQNDPFFPEYWQKNGHVYERSPRARRGILGSYLRFRLFSNDDLEALDAITPGVVEAIALPWREMSLDKQIAVFRFLPWIKNQERVESEAPSLYLDSSVFGGGNGLQFDRGAHLRGLRSALQKTFSISDPIVFRMLPTAITEQANAFRYVQDALDPIAVAEAFQVSMGPEGHSTLEAMAEFMKELAIGGHRTDSFIQADALFLAEAFYDSRGILVTRDAQMFFPFFGNENIESANFISSDRRFQLRSELENYVEMSGPFNGKFPVAHIVLEDKYTGKQSAVRVLYLREL